MKLDSDIKFLKYVGDKRAALLRRLGINTVGDILDYYPRVYEDWSRIVPISQAPCGELCCIKAYVGHKPIGHLIRKGLTIYKTDITDGESVINVTIFNNKYAAEMLHEGEEYLFFGKICRNGFTREMSSPEIAKAQGGNRIRPIYPQTAGLTTTYIEKLIRTALESCSDEISETLPESVRMSYCLMGRKDALQNIHFPKSSDMLSEARRRLIFEELFILQIGLKRLKNQKRDLTGSVISEDFSDSFFSLLPFTPTGAQRRAVSESVIDMMGTLPMNRLLQGDVGSGKTAVAAALIYNAYRNGFQSTLMAPTEILAFQHHATLCKLLSGCDIKIELLTGSVKAKEKKRIKDSLKSGEVGLVIGTHALLQDDVEFSHLGFVVTDEQHRFGVGQRTALGKKGDNPHVLVMSATPIPRTLALIVYGDLDISVLDELPPGRQKIHTYAIDSTKRGRALGYIKKHLDAGRQGYIVCPLVDESEAAELASAEKYFRQLSEGFFSGYSVGLLHGKMKSSEKEKVMQSFSEGETQLLVSTTVIEVGVDVPNAVIMLIENAERFGLSQLHQLRGRIGRGEYSSSCILLSDAQNEDAKSRIKIMTETSDGFKIADEDLKLRGPGDFFGARQHGLPELKIADMLTDTETVHETADAVNSIIAGTLTVLPSERPPLSMAVKRLFSSVGATGIN